MKTLYTSAIILLLSITIFSCKKEIFCERGDGPVVTQVLDLDEIEGINLGLPANVNIFEDSVQRIEITGQSDIIERVKTNVYKKIWDIDYTRCVHDHDLITINIFLPKLKHAKVSGSGNITGLTPFHTDNLEVMVSGSGNIILETNANNIEFAISGSGSIELSGTSVYNDYKINGSGNIKSFNLVSNSSDVDIRGSGNAEVNASERLNVEISGSGNVFYIGKPSITQNINGSGNVLAK